MQPGNEVMGVMGAIIADQQIGIASGPPAKDEEPPHPQDRTRQGVRQSAAVLSMDMQLLDTIAGQSSLEDLGNMIARNVETQLAYAIETGAFNGETWWKPNTPGTEKQKAQKHEPVGRPLLASGELVDTLRTHRLPVKLQWKETESGKSLEVGFGWTKTDDPKRKYWDMLFGATCVGREHQVSVPARYPRVTRTMQAGIEATIKTWLNSSPDIRNNVVDPDNEFIALMGANGPDLLSAMD